MKKEILTDKLYYGFPVILVGYKDDKWGYNVTTSSSSYTLSDMLTIGVSKKGHAYKQIKKYQEFSINLPSKELLQKIEICGFYSGQNKLAMADLTYDKGSFTDTPLIDDCFLNIECVVNHIVESKKYVNIIATIKRRIVDENIIDENNNIIAKKINPIYIIGDDSKMKFRYLGEGENILGENMDCSNTTECS